MSKIGIDIRNIGKNRTGDEVVFFNLTKNLALIDSENEYYLFTDIIGPIIFEDIARQLEIQEKANFRIVSLPTKNRFTWNFWTLPRYLRKNPVDIYLTQYITPFFAPREIKIFTIIHDVSFLVYGKFIKLSDLFFLKLLIPLSLRRADKIIAVSQFTKSEIEKFYHIAPEKVAWIHNAVGDNFQQEIAAEKLAAVRKKYNLPEKFILYIGTLQPRKNLPTLIEAYANLAPEIRSDLKLVLAGGRGHNYDLRIDNAITKYALQNEVFLPGYVPEEDKPTLFKLSHIFCNPSFYEGFGITILEAMSLGIPAVASDIPPHREVAADSIAYFRANDSQDLAQRLTDFYASGSFRSDFSQKEKRQAINFSWEKTSQKLSAIFRQL